VLKVRSIVKKKELESLLYHHSQLVDRYVVTVAHGLIANKGVPHGLCRNAMLPAMLHSFMRMSKETRTAARKEMSVSERVVMEQGGVILAHDMHC
jgi:hypothetical protein